MDATTTRSLSLFRQMIAYAREEGGLDADEAFEMAKDFLGDLCQSPGHAAKVANLYAVETRAPLAEEAQS